jgi:cation diffusion facilitator CzcD-associated flavoprotein CzcO
MDAPRAEAEKILKTDLRQYAKRRGTDGPYRDNLDIDVLIIGAGFGGSFCLHEMRKQGYSTVLYDAGTSFGGTWRWNVYPGARVDSPVGETPIYELAIPEVYNTWTWSTNYPDWRELQAYFDHVDKVLDLSKDCAFESVVVSAEFDKEAGKWTVKTEDGRTAKAKFLIVAAGFAAKRYIPGFDSMDRFRGIMHHSSFWPAEGVDYDGKRVAIIGTGASGVQMIQEIGATAKQLTVFQRTPNLTLPMGRRDLTKEEQLPIKSMYPQILAYRERCFAGFDYDLNERNTFDDTPEEQEAFLESLWKRAGFSLWLGGYKDYLFEAKANRVAYDFWRKKQSPRVKNEAKKKILFPVEPPHPFGVKRPCLEQNYYEILDQDNVAHQSRSSQRPASRQRTGRLMNSTSLHLQPGLMS